MERKIALKVCGLRIEENIDEIISFHPDYIGFIFYEKSARFAGTLSPTFAQKIPNSIKKTGVFVDASQHYIVQKVREYGLNAIQLHGHESPKYCEELKNNLLPQIEIIKAFSIGESFDFSTLKEYLTCCDFFLFDTKGKHPGGNGVTFDWKLLEAYPFDKPFFLSGGIGLEHAKVINEISLPQLYAVDINSKFEVEPGKKNVTSIAQFKEEISHHV